MLERLEKSQRHWRYSRRNTELTVHLIINAEHVLLSRWKQHVKITQQVVCVPFRTLFENKAISSGVDVTSVVPVSVVLFSVDHRQYSHSAQCSYVSCER